MPGPQCKAALCAGSCLDGIIVDNFRELTDVTVTLTANSLLTDEQMDEIIVLYTRYEGVVENHKKADREARERLKEILDL